MTDQQMLMMLKGMQPGELAFLQDMIKDMTEQQKQQFVVLYTGKRKDPDTILLLTILGFFGVAGVQRIVIGEIGMGILFLFTAGLCFIGTIVDLIDHKKIAFEYNRKQALEAGQMIQMMSR